LLLALVLFYAAKTLSREVFEFVSSCLCGEL
jgi:hypothetical protein